MSTIQLNPKDNNYLTSNLVYKNLTEQFQEVTLANNIAATVTPKVLLDGQGRAYLQGSVTIDTASVSADMALLSLPEDIVPLNTTWLPVAVLRSGAYVANAIKIAAAGQAISSVTVTAPGSYATLPTASTLGPGTGATFALHMKAVSGTVTTAQSSTGSYVPADTLTLSGGTSTTASIFNIVTTKVQSATVAAGGSGGTDGTQTVTGTTGTGTKFQASVTVSGGAITAVLSITVGGIYTVNPSSLTAEPVTGASLTGAQLNIKMGVNTIALATPGDYTALPSSPVSTTTSGSGTGCTLTVLWGLLSVTVSAGGTGYTSDSSFILSGGGGTGGGTATIVLAASTAGNMTLITQPQQNDIVVLDSVQFITQPYS